MNKTLANILRITIGVLFLIAISLDYILFRTILVTWWMPACLGAFLPVITLPLYKKWASFTRFSNRFVNLICHILCTEILGYTLIIAGNYYFRDTDSPETAAFAIVDKHSEIKKLQQRIGKHRYRTTHRQEFYIEVALDDERTKTLYVTSDFYRKAKGDTLELTLEKGLLGFPVIKKF